MPVTEIPLEHGVSAGVELRILGRYIVPVYEEQQARLERNIGLEAWLEMSETEKALIIASRRIQIAIANLQAEAEINQAEREARKRRN